jgi:UDP-N-acetylglucosamine--N-acetylmuramyl-(pentapeptide) pyrophosphoryl-undecaprenol N-acetylglucosamine transferase
MKYLLTGGGTGGHVYPALAIADEIRRRHPGAEFLYVGMRKKLESWVVPARGYDLRCVQARPFPRSSSISALARFALGQLIGALQATVILLRFRPDLIIGTGGYGSAPILFACSALAKVGLCRARVFVYEPNAYPGLLNQVVGRSAHRIGVAFEKAARWFDMKRVAVVGYPIRREFLEGDREQARRAMGIAADRRVLLVFGGSSGSRVINQALVSALPRLRLDSDILILHITGRYAAPEYNAVADTGARLEELGVTGDTSSWYRRLDYMDDIQKAYHAADLVICRGGAGTLTEVAVCGLPALIAPLPTAAEDHQAINARELERMGAARVLYQQARWRDGDIESSIDPGLLASQALELLQDGTKRSAMARAAASVPTKDSLELILRELEGLVTGQRPPPLDLEYPPSWSEVPADPNQLLRRVKERIKEAGGVEQLDVSELAYLRYQADRLLVSRAWYEIPLGRRNVGIKLVGSLQYREHLPLLLAVLLDRRPVHRLKRALGGDFCHGGLLRRNVIEQALLPLGVGEQAVRTALLQALAEDPYFEVRSAAAGALGTLCEPDPQIERGLVCALADRSDAVVVRVLRSLGMIGTDPALLTRLQAFYLSEHWPFRLEVVEALGRLLERGVVTRAQVAAQLDQILATSSYFKPEFPLNEELRRLAGKAQAAPDLENR